MTISTTTLKNAAFAIECDLWTDQDGANYLAKDGAILRRWEPEHNSGDAFNLAADLSFDVMINHCGTEVASPELYQTVFMETKHDDVRATARLAILLAASAVGMDE